MSLRPLLVCLLCAIFSSLCLSSEVVSQNGAPASDDLVQVKENSLTPTNFSAATSGASAVSLTGVTSPAKGAQESLVVQSPHLLSPPASRATTEGPPRRTSAKGVSTATSKNLPKVSAPQSTSKKPLPPKSSKIAVSPSSKQVLPTTSSKAIVTSKEADPTSSKAATTSKGSESKSRSVAMSTSLFTPATPTTTIPPPGSYSPPAPPLSSSSPPSSPRQSSAGYTPPSISPTHTSTSCSQPTVTVTINEPYCSTTPTPESICSNDCSSKIGLSLGISIPGTAIFTFLLTALSCLCCQRVKKKSSYIQLAPTVYFDEEEND